MLKISYFHRYVKVLNFEHFHTFTHWWHCSKPYQTSINCCIISSTSWTW